MSAISPAPQALAGYPARWWHGIENKKVVCTLCPRECHIPNGSRGFCFVRANVDGRLELTTYGRSSGFCIDPIEKKPLNHFLPGTPILSFGTAGCNLGCKFCQNWDISKSREVDTISHTAGPEAIAEAALKAGCRSLAFTYNDPAIWAEYAIDIAQEAHRRGLKTVAVTAGYMNPDARREFYEHMDAANVDLKAFTDTFYSKLCQVNLNPILETLKYLKQETSVWFELTNLMIPGENDSPDETKAMCDWIYKHLGPDVPVHFTAFHPDFKMRDIPPTPPQTLIRARQIARNAGIRYAFVGNVNDVENQSTYCHACGKLLIQRDWYELGDYHLRGNTCGFCGTVIPGVFDDAGPGKWGRKRQPITIQQPPSELIRITTKMTEHQPTRTFGPAASAPERAARGAGPQIEFTPEEDGQILRYTREVMASALRSELFCGARLPESLANAPAYGIFVSLHRGKQLRSCKGQWSGGPGGSLTTLGQILPVMARDALTNDPRFPRITMHELPFLTLEISLMHSPEILQARGEERASVVQLGKHGLVIAHPAGRGLLLPHVATEAGWDARTFLEQLCRKAGLPPQAWREDQAQLMTFQARKLEEHSPHSELNLQQVGNAGLNQLLQYIERIVSAPPGADLPPEAEFAETLREIHTEELGLCLQTASGVSVGHTGSNASLLNLAAAAAKSLSAELQRRGLREPVLRMTLLLRPLDLSAADYPHRLANAGSFALRGQVGNRWSIIVPQPNQQQDAVSQVLGALQITPQQWQADRSGNIRLTLFHPLICQNQSAAASAASPSVASAAVRPAFRAGQFYPADERQMNAQIDHALSAAGPLAPQPCRAIMLPHAGWLYCQQTLARTLVKARLPKTVIILGPRHTPLGANNSVASHQAWQIPGATIPIATALVQRLNKAIPELVCESEAHRQEHGTEVLLPFLHRLRPDLQIVPIVLGQCTPQFLAALSRELASILRDAQSAGEEAPLLVISSDMNHFADEQETRRRDQLALQALTVGDPQLLLDTCRQNDISMCGVFPAAAVMQALRQVTPVITPQLIDYTTSAAVSGDFNRVVGYAGIVIP